MDIHRRMLLGGLIAAGAASALPARPARSEPVMPGWQLGYTNAPAAGYEAAPMRLISGRLPEELTGTLYRNGPAHFTYGDRTSGHWFDGDGMIQAIRFGDGRAVHRGRFVETPKRRAEQAAGRFLAPGFGSDGDPDFAVESSDDVNAANTSVLMVDGELLALWEAGSPWRLDPLTLESRGPKTWRADLKGMPFLAHPKVEPDGRIWNLAVSGSRVGIYRIGATGELEDFGLVDIGAAAYVHDWAMTETKLVILVQPWIQTRMIPPFVDSLVWEPERGLQILILEKDDLSATRWAEAPARAFYHTGAAWEDAGGAIHVDAALYAEPALGSGGGTGLMRGVFDPVRDSYSQTLTRILIPPSGSARLEETGVDGEFPTVDPRRHGRARRFTALAGGWSRNHPGATRLSLMDWKRGEARHFDFGPHRMVEEHLVVPKSGRTGETEAWLVGTALNTRARAQEVHVFDVADIAGGPVASFQADYAWPLGFHGTFVAA